MATRLKMVFNTAAGTTVTHSYNYADPDVATTDIGTLASTIVTNNAIYQQPPTSLKSAVVITTTETDVMPS